MKALIAAVCLVGTVACGPRQVEVRTAPPVQQAPELAIHMTNNLAEAINVYVLSGSTNIFVRQVPANSTLHLPVQGVASGSTVTLRATTADGSRTFSKDNVVLTGMFPWTVP